MTQKNIQQVTEQLKQHGQELSRAYSAFEGGIRVIGVDKQGNEYRYNVHFDSCFNATLVKA